MFGIRTLHASFLAASPTFRLLSKVFLMLSLGLLLSACAGPKVADYANEPPY